MNEYTLEWYYCDEDGEEHFESISFCCDSLSVRDEYGNELFNSVGC